MIQLDLQKLELLGKKYLIDFVVGKVKQKQEELTYRYYVTEALMLITKNTAHYEGSKYMTVSYREMTENKPIEPQRSSEDIKNNICNMLNSLGKEKSK